MKYIIRCIYNKINRLFSLSKGTFPGAALFILLLSAILPGEAWPQNNSDFISFSEKIVYNGKNKSVHDEIEKLNAEKINFKAQTVFSIPLLRGRKNGADAVKRAEEILTDVKNFEEIPYYSKRHESTYPLFKDIRIIEDYNDKEGSRIIITEQTILPFNPARMKYIITRDKNSIIFRATNIDKVSWWILPIISENRLLTVFAAETEGDSLECYGLGVADTGSFFFMRKRLKDAFNGRTEALIRWIYSELSTKLDS